MDKNSWKTKKREARELTQEEEKYFWRTYDDSEVNITDTQSLEFYNDFVRTQKDGFVNALYLVDDTFERLRLEGKISEYAKWYARIKTFENAMKNENKKIENGDNNKALDDIFGVRILGASEQELLIIQEALEKRVLVSTKKKDSSNILYNLKSISELLKACSEEVESKAKRGNSYHALGELFDTIGGGIEKAKESVEKIYEKENRKKTSREKGYNAKHRYYYLTVNQNIPMMEFQYWTVALDYKCTFGDLSYSKYKDLSREEIQRKYDNNEFKLGYNIPIIYTGKNSKGKIEPLSSEEALKKTYPFLNMNKVKTKEAEGMELD